MAKKQGDKPELLTKTEMELLINSVKHNLFFYTLYQTLRLSSRRIGELYGVERNKELIGGVRLRDIDFKNNTMQTIILKRHKRNLKNLCKKCSFENKLKNKFCSECGEKLSPIPKEQLYYHKPLSIYMPLRKDVRPILKYYLSQNNFEEDDFLFRKYSLVYLKKKIKKDVEKCGIRKNFSLHGFRHYFITQCKRKGMTNDRIAKWTGHKNTSTIDIYNQLVPKDIEEEINEVDL